MADLDKAIKGFSCCKSRLFNKECLECPYEKDCYHDGIPTLLIFDALELLKEQEKEIKALRLLVEWAEECDFGFDQFHDEYERYKEEIKDMDYIEGMIHVAKRTLEDNGAFKGGEQE